MEKLFYIGNKYLYLFLDKEGNNAYKVYNCDGTEILARGCIALNDEYDFIGDTTIKQIEFDKSIVEFAISTMESFPAGKREYRRKHRNIPDRCIRFFNQEKDEQFRIPDGKTVVMRCSRGIKVLKCHYIDSYHFRVDDTIYHVYAFANEYEQGGYGCLPEEESMNITSMCMIQGGFVIITWHPLGYQGVLYDNSFSPVFSHYGNVSGKTKRQVREEFMTFCGVTDDIFYIMTPNMETRFLRIFKMRNLLLQEYYAS